jgi:hypothetical protein
MAESFDSGGGIELNRSDGRCARDRDERWGIGLSGFGGFPATLRWETPDDRDEPPASAHDRGHDGP